MKCHSYLLVSSLVILKKQCTADIVHDIAEELASKNANNIAISPEQLDITKQIWESINNAGMPMSRKLNRIKDLIIKLIQMQSGADLSAAQTAWESQRDVYVTLINSNDHLRKIMDLRNVDELVRDLEWAMQEMVYDPRIYGVSKEIVTQIYEDELRKYPVPLVQQWHKIKAEIAASNPRNQQSAGRNDFTHGGITIKWKAAYGSMWVSQGCEYPGYVISQLSSSSKDGCIMSCAQRRDCVAFTQKDGVCYLKNGPLPPSDAKNRFLPIAPNCAQPTVTCGYKGLTGHPLMQDPWKMEFISTIVRSGTAWWVVGCDFVNNDIRNVRSRPENCGGECERDAKCNTFTWSSYDGGTCWLKSLPMTPLWTFEEWPIKKTDGTVCGRIMKEEKNILGWGYNDVICN